MAEVGEAGTRDEPDIAGSDHRDTHSKLLKLADGALTSALCIGQRRRG
jgi:hypothetical protein